MYEVYIDDVIYAQGLSENQAWELAEDLAIVYDNVEVIENDNDNV